MLDARAYVCATQRTVHTVVRVMRTNGIRSKWGKSQEREREREREKGWKNFRGEVE